MVIIVLLVAAALFALVIQPRNASEEKARVHALSVAQAIASAPSTVRAMTSGNPTAELQPFSRRARKLADVGIITTYNTDGNRWSSSPRPDLDELHLVGGRLLTLNVRRTEPYGASGIVVTLRDTTESVAFQNGRKLPGNG